jgi:hypothetical protein
VTTNAQLKELMDKHRLTSINVCELLSCSVVAVQHWRQNPEGTGHRNMPVALLELLMIKLGEK